MKNKNKELEMLDQLSLLKWEDVKMLLPMTSYEFAKLLIVS